VAITTVLATTGVAFINSDAIVPAAHVSEFSSAHQTLTESIPPCFETELFSGAPGRPTSRAADRLGTALITMAAKISMPLGQHP